MAIQSLDSQPWYKQFWPWFLILLPASVVVAATITMIIARTGADDLVAQSYYKDGLAINRRLEKENQAKLSGISATLQFSDSHVSATLSGDISAPFLSLYLSHPLEADKDFNLKLDQISSNYYRAQLPQPVREHWHWRLEPPAPSAWELNGKVRRRDFSNEG